MSNDPMSSDALGVDASKVRKWRFECAVQSLVECLVERLPGAVVYRLGECLGRLAWFVLPTRRRIVMRNLRIVCGDSCSRAEIMAMARENFRRTGGNLISVARTAGLKLDKLHRVMRVTGVEWVEQALARGQGVVLLLAHMGNWEMLSRIMHFLPEGTQTGAFYRPLNNPFLDQRVRQRRELDGTHMFSKRESAWQVASFLRQGGLVGILADQRVGMQGEVVEFFGRRTRGSGLPTLMARRGRSALVSLSLRLEGPGKWVADFEEVGGNGSVADCMAALEAAMRRSLLDVFWLQDRWKVYAHAEGGFAAWLPAELGRSAKPHRALVWLVGGRATDWERCLQRWQHPDLDLEVAIAAEDDFQAPEWVSRVHRVDECAVRRGRGIWRFLERVDAAEVMPLDLVLAYPGVVGGLRKAAKQLQATYVELI